MINFVKFPVTPHIDIPCDYNVRNDKILSLSEMNELLSCSITVEEKIDGSNVGISFSKEGSILIQNRGNYLMPPYKGQWAPLGKWLDMHIETLFDFLSDRFILFGEWCYAKHSVVYNKLPDWFIAFDIFDLEAKRFYSVKRRTDILFNLKLYSVPIITQGHFTIDQLRNMFGRSHFGDEICEGLYLRYDEDNWLHTRAKLVRTGFFQSIGEHWTKGKITKNVLLRY